jgi:glucose/arabinose dehydrogenase
LRENSAKKEGIMMQRKLRRLPGLLLVSITAMALLSSALSADHQSSPIGDPMVAGLQLVADGLTAPVHLVEPPDGSDRLFIVDQIGLIRILSPEGALLEQPFLDLQARMVTLRTSFDERGLLGLAFHPDYANNGRFFVYYSAPLRGGGPAGWDHTSHISEFHVSDSDPNLADPDSERILLQVDQPQANHNAGMLAFGPADGFLYISLGDGGGSNDVGLGHTPEIGNAQDITNLLGSILRIDVDQEEPYAVPSDNPFIGAEGRDEIYAYGLRNPYRFSFDMGGNHRMFAADAGERLWEEVSIIALGGNYGWNVKEGTHCFNPPAECPDVGPVLGDPLVDPVIEYPNVRGRPDAGLGLAVIGGYVYRGDILPQFRGRYIFGDWRRSSSERSGSVFVARERRNRLWQIQEIRFTTTPDGRLGHFLLGFGQDRAGEIYILTSDRGPTGDTGKVYKLISPMCSGMAATIVGTPGNDNITGTQGNDVIVGLDGNDNINGGGGNDVICGDGGRDILGGGPGSDTLDGGIDIDTLNGGPGNDTLRGGSANDILRGQEGNDRLDGGSGNDICLGGPGNDTLVSCNP